jgi:hypothetical protein
MSYFLFTAIYGGRTSLPSFGVAAYATPLLRNGCPNHPTSSGECPPFTKEWQQISISSNKVLLAPKSSFLRCRVILGSLTSTEDRLV